MTSKNNDKIDHFHVDDHSAAHDSYPAGNRPARARFKAIVRLVTFMMLAPVGVALIGSAAQAATGSLVVETSLPCKSGPTFLAYSWSFTSNPGQKPATLLTITKPFDGCSVALFKASLGGTIKSILLHTVDDASLRENTKIEFVNLTVYGYQLSSGNAGQLESIAFTYESVVYHQ